MSSYSLNHPKIGEIKVTKKRGMRSLRLRISPNGAVNVSAPWSVPRPFIERFINERESWIEKNRGELTPPLENGVFFGNGTRLIIEDGNTRNHSSVSSQGLRVKLAGRYNPSNSKQQRYIEKKVIEAMQNQAENELLPRLHSISKDINHDFNQAYVKRLTSRWGSCDQSKNITLNVFLLQLPVELQDYVILHELTHTKFMNHSPEFWNHMQQLMPNSKVLKKEIKKHLPRIEIQYQA